MNMRTICKIAMGTSVVILASCTADVSDNTVDTGTGASVGNNASSSVTSAAPAESVLAVADSLRTQGLDVNVTSPQSSAATSPFPNATAYSININGQTVQAYEYLDEPMARRDAETVASDGSKIGDTTTTWMGTPHFYRTGKMILLYLGNNSAIMEPLARVAGQPFAQSTGAAEPTGTGATL